MAETEVPEMIEKVAIAILKKVPFGYGMTKSEADEYARAAIAEMRQPTEQMVWDGGTALHDEKEDTTGVWKAMIDSALNSRP